MKTCLLAAAAALAAPLTITPASAQSQMAEGQPQLANKEWYSINFVKFHNGKMEEALELIETFESVDAALGREGPIKMVMNTGEWDMMIAFKMHDGIAQMGWESNPRDDAWNAELARQLGSEEAVAQHWARFGATVDTWRTEIGHIDLD